MKFVCAMGLWMACGLGLSGPAWALGEGLVGIETGVESGIEIGAEIGIEIGAAIEADDPAFRFVQTPGYRELSVSADSGIIRVSGSERVRARAVQVPVWSKVIRAEDADWVRVRFGEVLLARSTQDTRESYLRITSLDDGYEQYLDADSLEEWGNTTAYFNGDAVLIELMVSPNASDQINRVRVIGVQASDPVSDRSICFGVDDRTLSADPRDARLMPMGCSAWLFGDQGSCFMTAGHCGVDGGDVVQFNVPLSSSGGGTRNPPPQDQYVVDALSVQSTGSVFIGNDWSVFGVFDNSSTGFSPLQAQGASHTLAPSPAVSDGRPIRITGYGTVSSPVPASWNQVQKTHVGPLTSASGSVLRYQTDTTGGNSGSAVLDEQMNMAIGIHTNGGCGGSGGSNSGTSIFNSGVQNALANPQGMCAPRSIQASLLFEPTFVSPDGGDVVTLVINNLHGHTVAGLPTIFVDSGMGFVGSSMTQASATSYEASFESFACGTSISYYISIEDEEGTIVTVPQEGASRPFETIALDELTIAVDEDFEADTGWFSFNAGATAGDWFRSVPADHGLGDPATDGDGSGKCYLTANNNGVDVDGGGVVLMSPVFDLSSLESPTLEMAVWMFGQAGDSMEIAMSSNAGVSWTVVDSFSNTDGWEDVSYSIADYVDPSLAFRARITVTDGGADSTVEGAVDGVLIASKICQGGCRVDINDDGTLNFFDVSAFLSAFGEGDPIADFTDDGVFNFFDVSAFLSAFGDGCP